MDLQKNKKDCVHTAQAQEAQQKWGLKWGQLASSWGCSKADDHGFSSLHRHRKPLLTKTVIVSHDNAMCVMWLCVRTAVLLRPAVQHLQCIETQHAKAERAGM